MKAFFDNHGLHSATDVVTAAGLAGAGTEAEVQRFLDGDGSRRTVPRKQTKDRLAQLVNFLNMRPAEAPREVN